VFFVGIPASMCADHGMPLNTETPATLFSYEKYFAHPEFTPEKKVDG
jgi:hypothetical protein